MRNSWAWTRRRLVAMLAAAASPGGRTRAAPPPGWAFEPLDLPTPWQQLRAAEGRGWLGVDAEGGLWRAGAGPTPERLAEGVDPRTPVAAGHGRVAARRRDGRLWVGGGAPDAGVSEARLAPDAGLLILPLAVIAVAGEGPAARLVRLEPGAGALWRVTARSAEPVLPDARPLQIDLDGRGDGGHLVVLAGPDRTRYPHGVLGDDIEATRVLWLERHDLAVLRALDIAPPHVIEDIAPRSWAPRGGTPVLVTLRSGPQGGQLVAIEPDPADPRGLVLAALGPPMGTRKRWLAPSTEGRHLVAVHTPHLGGVLHRYRRYGRELLAQRLADGVSNHAIGSRELDVSAWSAGRHLLPGRGGRVLRVFGSEGEEIEAPIELPEPVRQMATGADGKSVAWLGASGRVIVIRPMA